MKRTISMLIVLVMVMSLVALSGCSSAGDVETGLGTIISIEKSKDATDEADGLAQVDTVMAAVTMVGDKIATVTIDTAQTKVGFTAAGAVTADKAADYKTKVELGDDYGMKARSGIGKEWYEQIADFEDWLVGKTLDDVKGIKTKDVDGSILIDEADLTSKVTISVDGYIAAVTEAIENAK